MKLRIGCVVVGFLSLVLSLTAQTAGNQPAATQVPPFIQFSSVASDVNGKPLTGMVGVTFYFYAEQQGGAPLWLETQNVQPDQTGHYTVLLGSTTSQGLPAGIFASGEAHWLGVQVQGGQEQPRVLLVSAPYALKAADAETLGGKPLSAFVLNETQVTSNSGFSAATQATVGISTKTSLKPGLSPALGGTGTTDFVAKFINSTTLGNSLLFDNGTDVGIGTTTPGVALDIAGNNVGLRLSGAGTHQVTITGATSGRLGQDSSGFFFSSDTNGSAVRILTNNGTLNEWMRITSAGKVGIGTTTPATALDVNGAVNTATSFNLEGALFAYGSLGNENAFLGFAGNSTMTGKGNTANGLHALEFNTTGSGNTACGSAALLSNTTGGSNTASGYAALSSSTTGSDNTAIGSHVLYSNTTGSENTAIGINALYDNTTGYYNTANGWQALYSNTTGTENTASGYGALFSNTGNDNTADGKSALVSNTAGLFNTASGAYALGTNTTGDHNTALGDEADVGTGNRTYATAIGANAVV